MEKVRFGLIGIGAQGGAYAGFLTGQGGFPGMPAPQCPPHCALGALCDIDPEKEKMCREKYPDVPFFKDWKEMVASGTVDAVITTVPHYLHHEIAIYCLEHGMNVLVEKPAGVRAKDVMAMNKCAEEHPDVAFGIMFNQRTNKLYQKIKEIVASGELGEIRRSNWIINTWWRPDSYYQQSEWRATWGGEGGGVLVNQAPHQLDLWQWICGIPTKVTSKNINGSHRKIDVENDVTIVTEYANGATGSFITCTHDAIGTDRLEIDLDGGKIVVEDSKKAKIYRMKKTEPEMNETMSMMDVAKLTMGNAAGNPDIELCAVCDIDPEAGQRAPEGVPFYTDYEEMLREAKPDCVHVCLPHYLHYPVSKYFAEHGVNVFCEKPVALNTAQAKEFAALETAHPEVHIGICLQNRLNESVEMLKSIIESGEYGRVLGTKGIVPWARPKQYYDCKPWRGKWETAGGGCMINQSVHTLDLLYFLGGSVKSLRASVSQLLDYGIEVEDTVAAQLTYADGGKGLFMATNANYKNESVQIGVQLEKADFAIIENVLYRVAQDGSREELCEDARLPGTKFYYGASHAKLIGKFYKALEDGTDDYIHVRDAEMSIRLIDAVQEAGRTGGSVAL